MRRVAITGIGVVSPIGASYESFTRGLDEGRIGTVRAPWADPERGRHAWYAPVTGDFDAAAWLDERTMRGTVEFSQFALVAAEQAIRMSGLEPPPDTAVVMGTAMAGASAIAGAQSQLDAAGPEAVPRRLPIQVWANLAAGHIAMRHGLHGPSMTICTACAAGTDAIGLGTQYIRSQLADVVVAGGTDHALSEVLYQAAVNYGASQGIADRELASAPFDIRRSGVLEGAGAAVLVLEDYARARRRGARVLGTVEGYAALAEAYHPSAPQPDGAWEAEVMRRALVDAGAEPAQVSGIVAHATSTPKGDAAEIAAINDVFGGRESLHVTSVKGSVGHTAGASGPMGVAAALHAFDRGRLAHLPTTTQVEPDARFHVVTDRPAEGDFEYIQVNSFGFGGQDSSLVLRREER